MALYWARLRSINISPKSKRRHLKSSSIREGRKAPTELSCATHLVNLGQATNTASTALGLRAQPRSPGTEFLDAKTGRQKPPLKCANACRDQNRGNERPEIPVETPYLASYRNRAVCGDWVVPQPPGGGLTTRSSNVCSAVRDAGTTVMPLSKKSIIGRRCINTSYELGCRRRSTAQKTLGQR
jgi:hypothetical protein